MIMVNWPALSRHLGRIKETGMPTFPIRCRAKFDADGGGARWLDGDKA
jgi:hypothetical protein